MSTRTTHVRARLIDRDRLLILGTATEADSSRDDVYPVTYPSGEARRPPVEGDRCGVFYLLAGNRLPSAVAPGADAPRPERRRDPALDAEVARLRATGMIR